MIWLICLILLLYPFLMTLKQKIKNKVLLKNKETKEGETKNYKTSSETYDNIVNNDILGKKTFPNSLPLFELRMLCIKKSIDDFFIHKYGENFVSWEAIQPQRLLFDNPIKIKLFLQNKVFFVNLSKLPSENGFEFSLNEIKSSQIFEEGVNFENIQENESAPVCVSENEFIPDDFSGNKPDSDDVPKNEVVDEKKLSQWLTNLLNIFEKEREDCIKNEYDFFIYPDNIPQQLKTDIQNYMELKGFYMIFDEEENKIKIYI